jgi:hypothetical protein
MHKDYRYPNDPLRLVFPLVPAVFMTLFLVSTFKTILPWSEMFPVASGVILGCATSEPQTLRSNMLSICPHLSLDVRHPFCPLSSSEGQNRKLFLVSSIHLQSSGIDAGMCNMIAPTISCTMEFSRGTHGLSPCERVTWTIITETTRRATASLHPSLTMCFRPGTTRR